MIPEPPNGTKLVLMIHTGPEHDTLVTRDDGEDLVSPGNWWFINHCGKFDSRTWAELLAIGTPHAIGPELEVS